MRKRTKPSINEFGVTFTPGNHQYRYEKKSVPSVTKIIGLLDKPALIPWAAKLTANFIINKIPNIMKGKVKLTADDASHMYQDAVKQNRIESKKATDIGTEVHEAAEANLAKRKLTKLSTPQAKAAFAAFKRWKKDVGLGEVWFLEQRVFHPILRYAGCVDLVGLLGGIPYVIDFKTSKGFYEPDMPMQVAAYAQALEQMCGCKFSNIGILRLDKETGEPHWRDYSPVREEMFSLFRHLCDYEVERRDTNGKLKGCAT